MMELMVLDIFILIKSLDTINRLLFMNIILFHFRFGFFALVNLIF